MTKTTGQKLGEEGRIQGREEGCQVPAKALKLILISRFHELTGDQNLEIDASDLAQLDTYIDRVIIAKAISEVLT